MCREELITQGNIVRTAYRETAEAGCCLENGRFGAVMSGLGLHMSPAMQKKYPKTGQTQYMHMEHWGRFRFLSDAVGKETTADYLLPLCKIYWENEPEEVEDYRQCQNFYEGTLKTSYRIPGSGQDGAGEGSRICVLTWFDQVNKNLTGLRLEVSGETVPVRIAAVTEFIPYPFLYRKETAQRVRVSKKDGSWCIRVCCEDTVQRKETEIYVSSTAETEVCEDGIRILASEGSHEIFISVGEPVDTEDAECSLQRTKEKWKEKWEKSGWLDFPEETAQKLWIRSLAYLLSAYDDDSDRIQPTNGLTGNMFPFHFVQDMEYQSPALMMLGHADIVKRWVEKFAGQIEEMKVYAKSLWPDTKGIYPPWELPHGSIEGYHKPSVPVIYCYEPHNAGYLCRMAKEAADFLSDSVWTEQYVYPLVREIAEFYESACTRKADGHWHLSWYPCIGQDEAGGRNKSDYLCSLYSAKYTFQTAVSYGLDEQGKYAQILKDGLAFESLHSERGILHTAQDADDFGRQKHPVQLDGVSYFPTEKEPFSYEKKAYELRHEITERAKEPFYYGWTLGQFLLSGSNMKDAAGWRYDWEQLRKSDYVDSEWIQLYETSTESEKSFYLTTHGMILQSLIRNYVNDYWGELEVAGCPVFEGPVAFGNIAVRSGGMISGTVKNGKVEYTVKK